MHYSSATKDDLTISTCHALLPLYGRWCRFSLSTYCRPKLTIITFGLKPVKVIDNLELSTEATYNGILTFRDGNGGHARYIDQTIEVPEMSGYILDNSDITDGGVEIGRLVSKEIMKKFEAIVETARQHIVKHLGTSVRQRVSQQLEKRYGQISRQFMRQFVGEIDWPLMFANSNCGEQCSSVIKFTLANNPINIHPMDYQGISEVPVLSMLETGEVTALTLADIKATALLSNICGPELTKQFNERGYITVRSQGYSFKIAPSRWVQCIDPSGHGAELCIHTVGLSCNPIDEVCLAYLYITNKLEEYMNIAIVHRADRGFTKKVA